MAALASVWGCGGGGSDGSSVSAPALALSMGSSAVGATACAAVTFVFQWSRDVGSSFTQDDVVVSGGTPSDWRQMDATRCSLVVTPPGNGAGTITLAVVAGRASDATGQANAQATQLAQAYDTRAAGWNLVWSDGFQVDGLPDASQWDCDTERNRIGWFNNELPYYARDRLKNARVDNGRLSSPRCRSRYKHLCRRCLHRLSQRPIDLDA